MDIDLFSYRSMSIKVKHTSENKVCLQSGNVPIGPEFKAIIHVCYSQQIGYLKHNFNTTYLGHNKNPCFNPNPTCIILCVKSTSWLLVVE